MKIVQLVAGAGPMYCGSCLHANTLASALIKAGQDVLLAPVYTPVRTDEESVSIDRVLFGGLNVYLQQKSALFRHTPWLLDRLLDRPALLGRLASRSSATAPDGLGDMTVSMLRGEEGRQRKELKKLLHWLKQVRPDIVHLSNVLLVGMARQITRQLGVPVVCTLSGEDIFLERLAEPYYSRARAALRERCGDLTALVALNRYYAEFMAAYLAVDRQRIHVIPPGLNLAGHAAAAPPDARRPERPADPVTIGFLARICPEKGLRQLAEAFALLAGDASLAPLRLRAAGYLGPGDQAYLAQIVSRLTECGLDGRFGYLGSLDRREKIDFLASLRVMCLPTAYPESKGLPVLEAWANGVPVVLPAHGVFPELIADTGGGLLYRPGDVLALTGALRQLIEDPELAAACGRRGQAAVGQRYHAELMAQRTMELYRQLCPTSPV